MTSSLFTRHIPFQRPLTPSSNFGYFTHIVIRPNCEFKPANHKEVFMRVSDDRYSRDRLRLDLAVRFIEHEARTRTIRLWTGLTDDRIRKLYRSYLSEGVPRRRARHRGKSPQQTA